MFAQMRRKRNSKSYSTGNNTSKLDITLMLLCIMPIILIFTIAIYLAPK